MVVGCRFDFHARSHHTPIMTDLFLATYSDLVLLTKARKSHSLSYITVNMLIELASNSTRYTGGKLAIARHPDTCPI